MKQEQVIMEEYKIAFDTYEISNYGNLRKKLHKGTYKYIVGSLQDGYRRYCLMMNGRPTQVYCHRLVGLAFLGECPEECNMIDHIDRNKLNNHISNLRWATARLNMQNKDNFKNYTEERKWKSTDENQKYRVNIRRDGERYSKTFETKDEAHECVKNETFYDAKKINKPREGHIHEFLNAKGETRFRAMRRLEGQLYTKIHTTKEECQKWIDEFKNEGFEVPQSQRRKQGGGNISQRTCKNGSIKYDAKIKIEKKQIAKTFNTKQEAEEWLNTLA